MTMMLATSRPFASPAKQMRAPQRRQVVGARRVAKNLSKSDIVRVSHEGQANMFVLFASRKWIAVIV